MATPLRELFGTVEAFDAHDYGYAGVRDFLSVPPEAGSYDWIVTNPPFRLAEEFVWTALDVASIGVAMIVRTMFLEGRGRYERLFSVRPPTRVAQFTERVPMVRGRMSKASKTATGYAWLVWERDRAGSLAFSWVPPCRKRLERDHDYDVPAPLTGLRLVSDKGGPA
ncbi:SAM-dependent methyltransferase [Methylobacterium hispanicum]|uniref:SAM-dependent methyltransferase n=1 Tax=Methylobacterium hispanicum TaxID=270350 RepID=UPI002F3512CE